MHTLNCGGISLRTGTLAILPYVRDTIFDIKRYTVRRFTLAAYSTMDYVVNVGGYDVVYGALLVANPRNVFFPVSRSQQLNTTSFLFTILKLKYNNGATGIYSHCRK